MAEAAVFATPRQEEMMKTISMSAGAGITGLAEGMIVRIAPQMGAAAPVLTWGALIGTPMIGMLGGLFTRGMLGDVLMGVAAGGIGVLGYSLPELIAPTTGRRRVSSPSNPAQISGGSNPVKQLSAGQSAAQRAQTAVRSSVEF